MTMQFEVDSTNENDASHEGKVQRQIPNDPETGGSGAAEGSNQDGAKLEDVEIAKKLEDSRKVTIRTPRHENKRDTTDTTANATFDEEARRETLIHINRLSKLLQHELHDVHTDGKVRISGIQRTVLAKRTAEKQNVFLSRQIGILMAILFLSLVINGAMVAGVVYSFKDTTTSDNGVLVTQTDEPKAVGTAKAISTASAGKLLDLSAEALDSVERIRLNEGGEHEVSLRTVNWLRYTRDDGTTPALLFELEPTKFFGNEARDGSATSTTTWPDAVAILVTRSTSDSSPVFKVLDNTGLQQELAEWKGEYAARRLEPEVGGRRLITGGALGSFRRTSVVGTGTEELSASLLKQVTWGLI